MVRSLHSASPGAGAAAQGSTAFIVQAMWAQEGSQDYATPEEYLDDYSSAKFEFAQLERKVADKPSATVTMFKRVRSVADGAVHWGSRDVLDQKDLDPHFATQALPLTLEAAVAA